MSWQVTRVEWLEAATRSPAREPLRSFLDEVDGRLCGLLGFDLRPPEPGAVHAEVPALHSGAIMADDEPEPADAPEVEATAAIESVVEPVAAPWLFAAPARMGERLEIELSPASEPPAAPEEHVWRPKEEAPSPVMAADAAESTATDARPAEAELEAPSSESAAEQGSPAAAQPPVAAASAAFTVAPSLFMPASLLRPPEEPVEVDEPAPDEASIDESTGLEPAPATHESRDAGADPAPDDRPAPVEDLGGQARDGDQGVTVADSTGGEMLDGAEFVEDDLLEDDSPEQASRTESDEHVPPRPPPPRRRNWYDDVFTEHFSMLCPDGVEESAARDVEFALACTEPAAGASVLDVGCGTGHHAIKLAELGYRVTGVDSSLAQLLRASELNEDRQAGASFLHGDMRGLGLEEQFDLVLCLGTTFGYFEEDVNRQVLEEIARRVKPGGKLVLQVFNRDYMVAKLPIRSWWQGHKCLVLDEAELNYKANRLRVHRTIVFEDGRQFEHYLFIRAYSVHDLGKMLSSAGLKVTQLSGSRETRDRFYGAASPDIWIAAERRARE